MDVLKLLRVSLTRSYLFQFLYLSNSSLGLLHFDFRRVETFEGVCTSVELVSSFYLHWSLLGEVRIIVVGLNNRPILLDHTLEILLLDSEFPLHFHTCFHFLTNNRGL